jgi:hypothetical protein
MGHPESHPARQYHAIFATEPAPVETDRVSEIVKIDSWGSLSPMPLTLDREKSGESGSVTDLDHYKVANFIAVFAYFAVGCLAQSTLRAIGIQRLVALRRE